MEGGEKSDAARVEQSDSPLESDTHPGGLGSRGAGAGAEEKLMMSREEAMARTARNCPPELLHFPLFDTGKYIIPMHL